MNMRSRRSLFWFSFLGVLALIAGGVAYGWRSFATDYLIRDMRKHGVVVESFAFGALSLDGVEFKDVVLSQPVAIKLPSLKLGLSRSAILQRKWDAALSSVTIDSVGLDLAQKNGAWWLNGQALPVSPPTAANAPTPDRVAIVTQTLARFPSLEIKHAELHVTSEMGELTAPVSLISRNEEQFALFTLHAGPVAMQMAKGTLTAASFDGVLKLAVAGDSAPQGSLSMTQMAFAQGDLHADIADMTLPFVSQKPGALFPAEGTLNANNAVLKQGAREAHIPNFTISLKALDDALLPLQAAFRAPTMELRGVPPEFARLTATALCVIKPESYDCSRIALQSADRRISASANIAAPYAAPERAVWRASAQGGPVLDGGVALVAMPQDAGFTAIKLEMDAKRWQLQPLLSLLAKDKIMAVGTVSGHMPLVWRGGQNFVFGQGDLHSDAPGVVKLSPELLGLNDPQIARVSGVLSDFRFETLGIALQGTEAGGLKARLSLLGHNPTAWNGRHVKLNVTLGGDLLSLLKQSILPMSDPRQWLENPSSPPPASSPR